METLFTKEVQKELKSIKQKNPKRFKKIQNQLKLFQQNPRYPSLRNHLLKGNLKNTRSISIESNFRMIYYTRGDKAVFFKIGTHEQVYQRN